MLTIRELQTGYGRVQILRGITLTVPDGGIVALLGGNGTGKSTLLKAVSGLIPVWSGSLEFDGAEIQNLAPDQIVRRVIKVGRHLAKVKRVLRSADLLERARYIERATMAEQRIADLASLDDDAAPYFSMIIVRRDGDAVF